MHIQTIWLTFPFDFLEELLQAQRESTCTARYFNAEVQSKGAVSNSKKTATQCKITWKPTANKQSTSMTLHADEFLSENGNVSCHISNWTEIDKVVKMQLNPKLNRQTQNVLKSAILKNTDVRRSQRKRKESKDDTSLQPKAQNPKRRKLETSSLKGLTPKVAKFAVRANQSPESTLQNQSEKEIQRQDLSKTINLRPRVSKVDWSALEEDSAEESGDSFHPDRESAASDNDPDQSPGSESRESHLPKAGVVKPAVVPGPSPKIHRVKRKKKKLAIPTSQDKIPMNKIVTRIAKFGEGTEIFGSVVNIATSFPLLECPGKIKVISSNVQTEGQLGPLSLVSLEINDNGVFEEVDKTRVSFYSDISRGVETHPKSYPKEFQRILVNEEASLPIVICLRKVTSRKHESWKKKLAEIQEIPGPVSVDGADDKELTEKNDDSPQIFCKKDLIPKHHSHTKGTKKDLGISAKLVALKDKMTTDPTQGKHIRDNSDSSSDSEEEYPDELELLRIPELSAVYPVIVDLSKSYVNLAVGNKIPLLDFEVCSSNLLKASGEMFYIQGKMEDMEGRVLLGPFSLEYSPRPYLQFMRFGEALTRIPPHIYERRRQRWLKKHDKKRFPTPTGGTRGKLQVAFTDHDYFHLSTKDSHASYSSKKQNNPCSGNDDQRETIHNQLQSQGIVIVSTKGLDIDLVPEEEEDCFTYDQESEHQIPVVGSLEDAMIAEKTSRPIAQPECFDSIHEPVTFEELPPVTMEATVNSTGIQQSYRVLRRQKAELSRLKQQQTLIIGNDDTFHVPMKYTCKICLKVLTNNFRLSDHIKSAHRNYQGFMDYAREILLKEGAKCKYCAREAIFYSRDGLRTHMNVHHPDKVTVKASSIAKRTCPTCKKVFAQRGVLDKHIQRIHVGAKYLCDKCPGIFKSEQALGDHIKGKHDNIRNFICDICGASYVTDTYLRKHIKNVHNKRKKAEEELAPGGVPKKLGRGGPGKARGGVVKKCFLCGNTFDTVNLKKHLKQIHGVQAKDIKKCAECSLTFNDRAELEYHRYAAHDYEYDFNCPYCGSAYIKQNYMHDHILNFHYSLNLYQCYLCDKNCMKSHKLTEHMLSEHKGIHTKEEDRKLSCNHCSELFKSHTSLIDHLLSSAHDDVFKYNCLACQQHFMHEHDLEHHIKVVHGKDRHAHFEIRCHSNTDSVVQMIVNKNINEIGDLPPKAQLALKRLQKQGKQVMIVSKVDSEKVPKDKHEKTTPRSVKKKPFSEASSKSVNDPVSSSMNSQNNNIVTVTDDSESTCTFLGSPKIIADQELTCSRSGPEAELLKVYRMAVQSQEVAKAVGSFSQEQHQEQEEDQFMSVEDEYVVAEQIGRLDESGNILEDRVVYVDEEYVSEDLLMMLQSQPFMQ